MTIKELKDLIELLPNTDPEGEPYEVWIGDGRVSNSVREAFPLNQREGGSDLLLVS